MQHKPALHFCKFQKEVFMIRSNLDSKCTLMRHTSSMMQHCLHTILILYTARPTNSHFSLCLLHTCGDCKNHTLFDNNVLINSFSYTCSFHVLKVLMKAFSARRWKKHYMIFFCLFLSIFYGVDEDIYGGSCASRGASIKRLHPRQRGHEMCSLTGRVTIKMSRQ